MSFGSKQQHVSRVRLLAALAAGWLASAAVRAAPPAVAAPLPQLPASFGGELPCAGCDGVQAQLDLWPDGTFHLRRRGALDDPAGSDQVGRWRRDPEAPELLLYGGLEAPQRLRIVDPRTLQASAASPPGGAWSAGATLVSDGRLHPADLSLRLHGMVGLAGDIVRFEECLSGRRHAIAMEHDAIELVRALRASPQVPAGSAVLASFDGAIEYRAHDAEATVVVRRLTGLWPGQSCERAMSHASLSNQYWRVGQLRGRPVAAILSAQETYVILRESPAGYVASAGCGRMAGNYRVEGTQITFDAPVVPLPACPAQLDLRQQELLDALTAARHWAIQGQVLELFDGDWLALAAFEAVYLH